MTYSGTNCRNNASWGKGKSMYSIIFKTASDFICDLKIHHNRLLIRFVEIIF